MQLQVWDFWAEWHKFTIGFRVGLEKSGFGVSCPSILPHLVCRGMSGDRRWPGRWARRPPAWPTPPPPRSGGCRTSRVAPQPGVRTRCQHPWVLPWVGVQRGEFWVGKIRRKVRAGQSTWPPAPEKPSDVGYGALHTWQRGCPGWVGRAPLPHLMAAEVTTPSTWFSLKQLVTRGHVEGGTWGGPHLPGNPQLQGGSHLLRVGAEAQPPKNPGSRTEEQQNPAAPGQHLGWVLQGRQRVGSTPRPGAAPQKPRDQFGDPPP